MAQFKWYKDAFLVREVIEHFEHSLPIIAQVEEGYYGILHDECHSKDDLFYITEVRHQERVAVYTNVISKSSVKTKNSTYSDVTTISLPLTCKLRFHVLGKNDYSSNAMTLQEIKRAGELHSGVRLRPDDYHPVVFKRGFANSQLENIILQDLTIKCVFTQAYLLGFPLPAWDSPYNAIENFPAHMDMRFKVARSLCKGAESDFLSYKHQLWGKSKELDYGKKTEGVPEIMIYSEEMKRAQENPYEFLSPNDYIRFTDIASDYTCLLKEMNSEYQELVAVDESIPSKINSMVSCLNQKIKRQTSEPTKDINAKLKSYYTDYRSRTLPPDNMSRRSDVRQKDIKRPTSQPPDPPMFNLQPKTAFVQGQISDQKPGLKERSNLRARKSINRPTCKPPDPPDSEHQSAFAMTQDVLHKPSAGNTFLIKRPSTKPPDPSARDRTATAVIKPTRKPPGPPKDDKTTMLSSKPKSPFPGQQTLAVEPITQRTTKMATGGQAVKEDLKTKEPVLYSESKHLPYTKNMPTATAGITNRAEPLKSVDKKKQLNVHRSSSPPEDLNQELPRHFQKFLIQKQSQVESEQCLSSTEEIRL